MTSKQINGFKIKEKFKSHHPDPDLQCGFGKEKLVIYQKKLNNLRMMMKVILIKK